MKSPGDSDMEPAEAACFGLQRKEFGRGILNELRQAAHVVPTLTLPHASN